MSADTKTQDNAISKYSGENEALLSIQIYMCGSNCAASGLGMPGMCAGGRGVFRLGKGEGNRDCG